jgi:hypothetical protein
LPQAPDFGLSREPQLDGPKFGPSLNMEYDRLLVGHGREM